MITENGVVTQTNTTLAWIKTTRSSACEACASRESCGTPGQLGKEMIVQVKNTLNVKAGDHVVIGLETKPVMMLTFLVYVVPIVALVAGALIGDQMGPVFGINPSLLAMILGFSSFGLAFLIIRRKSFQLNEKDGYKPFLVRKRNPFVSAPCEASHK